MTDGPSLTESDIRRRVGDVSFEKGVRYYRDGAILNPRSQGNTVKAQCQGSRDQPYRVEATLGPEGIVSAQCSCPVGGGGYCKHVAALLLSWLHKPAEFRPVEDLQTALERRSKPELIALLLRMVERDPELERLVELRTLADAGADQVIDPETIRQQVRSAVYGGRGEWEYSYGVPEDLVDVLQLSQGYAEQGNWWNAATAYRTLAEEILRQYDTMGDEEGEVAGVVNDCAEGLGRCLAEIDDPARRDVILRALFDIYRWDVDYGGIGIGDEVPDMILEQAQPEERQRVAEWVREALPADPSWSGTYRRQAYGAFLLDLQADRLDDESFLRICRETGRVHDLVDRLLALGRVDEAVTEARRTQDYDLLVLVDIFSRHGHADLAERLIRERAQTSQDSRLTVWLKDRAKARGDLAEALSLAEGLFWQNPAMAGYRELQELAEGLERWAEVRPQILARLAREGKYNLLTEIHLAEGEIDQALQTVTRASEAFSIWGQPLSIQVAQAAEESRPQEAIHLYLDAVRRRIDARGRDNYTVAAGYLVRVRELLQRLGQEDAWQVLIGNIRDQNRQLRALKEELAKAGL